MHIHTQIITVNVNVCETLIHVNCVFLTGILYGTMTLELGGKITIECEKTQCYTELEYKLKVSPKPNYATFTFF